MKNRVAVQALHDHVLRMVGHLQDNDKDLLLHQVQLDQLCWVLEHPYCVGAP